MCTCAKAYFEWTCQVNSHLVVVAGVTHVLSLCSDELPQHADIIYKVVRDLPDKPGADLRSRLPEMCDFVQHSLDAGKARSKGGAAVLVSCFQGKSRSASVIAAFLMRRHGFTVAQALDEVRRSRPQADPNLGYSTPALVAPTCPGPLPPMCCW